MNRLVPDPPAIVREVGSLDELAARINAEFAVAEQSSHRAVESYRNIGLALIDAKAQCEHGAWLPWLKANAPFGQRQARNYMQLAKSAVTADLAEQWAVILGNAKKPSDGAGDDDEDEDETVHNHRAQGTGQNEWYTPPDILEVARGMLGGFDLDPASSDTAQATVRAESYFTIEDDGLAKEWHGRVWLNPPYSQPAITHFVDKLVAEYQAGRTTEAILLTHNYTDTTWFHTAAAACSAVCFTRGRIAFLTPEAEKAAPTQGQAFTYFGARIEKFREHFSPLGLVLTRGRSRGH